MMTRRDVVAGSLLGTLATSTAAQADATEQSSQSAGTERALVAIRQQLEQIKVVLDEALRQVSLSHGLIIPVRRALEQFLRINGKFPDYLEVGSAVFLDVYDWHVKHQQPLQLSRTTDSRMVLRFMLTQIILRHEQEPAFVGPPFDRSA
ncbi:MAG: hypothetical protein ACRD2A_12505 [Vicinamibacterales bacterium]